jgi:ferredoxin-NADP reductase
MCPFANRVHGAFGESSVPYELADQLILVAGGVGATPLVSILGDLLSKATTNSSSNTSSSCDSGSSSCPAHSKVTLHVYAL